MSTEILQDFTGADKRCELLNEMSSFNSYVVLKQQNNVLFQRDTYIRATFCCQNYRYIYIHIYIYIQGTLKQS